MQLLFPLLGIKGNWFKSYYTITSGLINNYNLHFDIDNSSQCFFLSYIMGMIKYRLYNGVRLYSLWLPYVFYIIIYICIFRLAVLLLSL